MPFLYVCVYIPPPYVRVCVIHTHTHTHTHTFIRIHTHPYTHTNTHTRTHTLGGAAQFDLVDPQSAEKKKLEEEEAVEVDITSIDDELGHR